MFLRIKNLIPILCAAVSETKIVVLSHRTNVHCRSAAQSRAERVPERREPQANAQRSNRQQQHSHSAQCEREKTGGGSQSRAPRFDNYYNSGGGGGVAVRSPFLRSLALSLSIRGVPRTLCALARAYAVVWPPDPKRE